jgi:YHS domain-containing protein
VFIVEADSPHTTYNGQEIYFCCPRCIGRFERNPERYLNN